MEKEGLYRNHARYYDMVYHNKDYGKEATRIERLIRRHKKSAGNDLLEVACGTGKYLEHFKKHFRCTGIDINQGILEEARAKTVLKGVTLRQADMVDFELNRKFDVVACLFSSIGYVKTYHNLERTIGNFARHLKPGGVVLIEPWHTPKTYKHGYPNMQTYEGRGIKLVRMNDARRRGGLTELDMHFLVAERGRDVEYFMDRHELGLFDNRRILHIMREAGLNAKYLRSWRRRGMYIGVSASTGI